MNTDFVLKELEPPRGGAERFARRLDELAAEPPRAATRALAWAAAVAAVAVLTSAVWLRSVDEVPEAAATASPAPSPVPVEIYGAPEFDRLLGRTSPPAELAVVVNAETAAVTEIATANEKIRLYQIN
jgi:hypothetical protein